MIPETTMKARVRQARGYYDRSRRLWVLEGTATVPTKRFATIAEAYAACQAHSMAIAAATGISRPSSRPFDQVVECVNPHRFLG